MKQKMRNILSGVLLGLGLSLGCIIIWPVLAWALFPVFEFLVHVFGWWYSIWL